MAKIRTAGFALTAIVLLNILGQCEMSVYPGLRRKPLQQAVVPSFEVSPDFLAQLMEENARRRLQHQFEQQLEIINMQMSRQRELLEQRERYRQRQEELQALAETEADYANNINNNQYDQYMDNVDLTYDSSNNRNQQQQLQLQQQNNRLNNNINKNQRERLLPFAVGPSDARFYEHTDDSDQDLDSRALEEYEEYTPIEQKQTKPESPFDQQIQEKSIKDDAPVLSPAPVESAKDTSATTTFHRIKPQTAAAAAVAGVNIPPVKPADTMMPAATNTRSDINALIDKLQKQGKSGAIINSHAIALGQEDQMVVRQHLGMDGDMGLYIVALIAGVSASITVGLIALGLTWFHNKSKAAADVEYPAYGVTGPNKDISPSGDRKLAQSAQMYHYQHQKQQIIALENRQVGEGCCGLSDVDSDDDNEEGDYTVYECPGLAPTGEMEVKNPLFLDETPATPANNLGGQSVPITNNITQATPQQPPATNQPMAKKATIKAATNVMADEKTKRKNKK